ncbi:MAG: leucine-rich repeat protein [Alistipes sp.]|nr:leucine-rich repeat protein [Alistipes sp.]
MAVFGMIFTACSPVDDGNDNNAEQPGEETVFITDYEGNIVVGANGGVVVVTVSTNLEYSVEIPEEAQSWLSIADTRAIRLEKLTFTVAKNEADAERRAIVKLLGSDNAELQSLLFVQEGATAEETQAIKFQDENTKLLCTLHWDENEDGELSYEEAAAVTDLGTAFKGSSILAFSELEYFTSLEKIADSAFEGCVSLVKITLPEQVTAIGASAFNGCTNLKNITIPDSVTSIGEHAFDGCSSLTSVTIGNGVTSIGERAFSGCSSLTSVTIGNGVTSIGYNAFNGCISLPVIDNIRYADTCLVEAVDRSLTSYSIKAGTRFIGSGAFLNCSSLTSITIPDSVTSIGVSAFYQCYSLTSVTIPNSVTSIRGAAFDACTSLTSITIPDGVTSIGNRTFYQCFSLTSVTIPDSVTSIGDSAFFYCSSLKNITIPDSVTSIGSSAFAGCDSLKEVYCKPITPPSGGSSMFYKNASGRMIYVPRNSVNAYKAANGWKDYASNIEGYDF